MKKETETKKLIYIPALIALLVLSILLSASIGQVEIPLSDTFKILMERLFHVKLAGYAEIPSAYFNVVWMIRFPRALIAVAVGIGLSLCGIVMLERGAENKIERVTPQDAFVTLMAQTYHSIQTPERILHAMDLVGSLANLPVFRLQCNISQQAVQVAYEALKGETR